jgi:hypothetical protein
LGVNFFFNIARRVNAGKRRFFKGSLLGFTVPFFRFRQAKRRILAAVVISALTL